MYDVIVVGAGPVGATMALLCAAKGLRVCLLEKKTEPIRHPAAHALNGRTQEIWEEIHSSIAERVAAASMSLEENGRITWQTALVGETIGSVPFYDDSEVLARATRQGRWRTVHLGQHKLEPILWEAVRSEPLIDFRTQSLCADLRADEESVTAYVEGKENTESYQARYLISAEGANAVLREKLGITMVGKRLAELASVFFHAELPDGVADELPILVWLINKSIAGPVIRHADNDWILMTFYLPSVQNIDEFTADWWLPKIRAAIGIETKIEIKSKGTWTMTSEMADNYRQGRVFLVGDAAHRFPPTGGFGLNSGVADAHNLAWKLSAVLRHGADDALLDTYESERRPVVQACADQSVQNLKQLDLVNAHLGIKNAPLLALDSALSSFPLNLIPRRLRRALADKLMAKGLEQVARKLDPASPARPALLSAMNVDIQKQKEHFSAIGLEFGYAYEQGLVIGEPGNKPVDGDGVSFYRPTTWPGARLPYAELTGPGPRVYTHDLISRERFTLFTLKGDEEHWDELAADACIVGLGIEVRAITPKDTTQWQHEFEVGDGGAVLVRPDSHVAWRAKDKSDAASWTQVIATLNNTQQRGDAP